MAPICPFGFHIDVLFETQIILLQVLQYRGEFGAQILLYFSTLAS